MKIAVFGKPGGGKSTLSLQIAAATKLPLHQLDLVQYQRGGTEVPDEVFARLHAEIMAQEKWVVDGFGNPRLESRLPGWSLADSRREHVPHDDFIDILWSYSSPGEGFADGDRP